MQSVRLVFSIFDSFKHSKCIFCWKCNSERKCWSLQSVYESIVAIEYSKCNYKQLESYNRRESADAISCIIVSIELMAHLPVSKIQRNSIRLSFVSCMIKTLPFRMGCEIGIGETRGGAQFDNDEYIRKWQWWRRRTKSHLNKMEIKKYIKKLEDVLWWGKRILWNEKISVFYLM